MRRVLALAVPLGAAALLLAVAMIFTYRSSTLLLRPPRITPPDADDPAPGILPFAYNWPTGHPMKVLGPWPWQEEHVSLEPVRVGDEIATIDGIPLRWQTWRDTIRHVRSLGAGARVRLGVRRPAGHATSDLLQIDVELVRDVWLPSQIGLEYRDVSYTTVRGRRIRAWYLPGGTARGPIVIALHGMAASRQAMLIAFGRDLVARGYSLLLPDAPAHGVSPGRNADLEGSDELRAAVAFASRQPDVDPRRIVLLGHSYGAVKVFDGAVDMPEIAGVIAIAAPLSVEQGIRVVATRLMGLPDILVTLLMPCLSLWIRLRTGHWLGEADTLRSARRLNKPLLLVQGELDELWPPETASTLCKAAPGPSDLVMVPGVDHNSVLVAGRAMMDPLLAFLQRTVGTTKTPVATDHQV